MKFILLCLLALSTFSCVNTETVKSKPNVVIIFLDDSGYSDFSPFGKTPYPTPNVQKLADGGTKFTQFYVPQAVCSASRSALLTGCYPDRTKLFSAHGPNSFGLDPKFTTIAELLKQNGYTSAHYGKWHCGDQDKTRPLARGFDFHAGLMYSNDMWRHNTIRPDVWGKHPLQFWENGKVKIAEVTKDDQQYLTKWATENSVNFIKQNKDKPFFLYLAHSMPHVPLFCSPEFAGKSGVGLYGDVMTEIDWSVGQIEKTLKELNLEENTLIIFSSDNGPWTLFGNHAGKTPFRAFKGTSFDGGVRSALIVKFPGKVPAGKSSSTMFGSIDLFPTIAHLTDSKLPPHEIDGMNVWDLINGTSQQNPHEYYSFTTGANFEAIITGDGKWKLHLPHSYFNVIKEGKDGMHGVSDRAAKIDYSLYDMQNDPNETENVIQKFPDVAKKLIIIAEAHKKKFFSDSKQ